MNNKDELKTGTKEMRTGRKHLPANDWGCILKHICYQSGTKPLNCSLISSKTDLLPSVINIYCHWYRKKSCTRIFKDKKIMVAIYLGFLGLTIFFFRLEKRTVFFFVLLKFHPPPPNFQTNDHCACIVCLHVCIQLTWPCPVEVISSEWIRQL